MEIKSPEPNMTLEEKKNFYITRKRLLENKLQRIQLCVTTLKFINNKREEKYEAITKGNQGLFQLLHERKEAIITLTMHKDEADQNLMRLSKEFTKELTKEEVLSSNLNVNLPHLSLPIFDGNFRK
uniref:Uncharacterized protein n=1 Tax=Wuchereria bancrofti TaxID=6293 RepID=A0AAF5Q5W1_WUCBA